MVLSELVKISQRDLDKESSIYLSSSYSPIVSHYDVFLVSYSPKFHTFINNNNP